MLLLAVVALLVLWALRPWGGGGDSGAAGDGDGPAESITPGPTPSESLIDERPGGRDEASDGAADSPGDADGADGSSDGAGSAGGATGGSGDGTGSDGGATGGGSDDAPGDVAGDGDGENDISPAGLPPCLPADVTLSLRANANEYPQGRLPELRLTVQNAGDACRLDFGVGALTVTLADVDDERIWSSAVCPDSTGAIPVGVAAGGTVTHLLVWDRHESVEDCDAGPGPAAAPGTYLAEAELAGFPVAQTSFRLDED